MAAMAPFDWADPFRIDDQLTDEERMVRDAARGFAQGTLQPRVIEAFNDEVDAPDLVTESGAVGIGVRERVDEAGPVGVGMSVNDQDAAHGGRVTRCRRRRDR